MLVDEHAIGVRTAGRKTRRKKVQKAAEWEDARWCNLPPAVVEDLRLSLTHFRLLAYIGRVGRSGGWCALSQKEAAARFGVTRQTVNRAVGDLIEWGYLQKRSQSEAKSATCEYRVFLDAEPVDPSPETTADEKGTCNVEVTRVEPTVYTPCNVEVTPHNKEEAEEAILAITPLPPKGGGGRSASRAGSRKRSTFTAEQTKLTENAFALWNEIAPKVNGQRVKAITDARRRRMLLRLDEIGGIDQFAVALSAIERVPFLMGKVPPKPGQAPFKLDIDRLLQTDGNLGDVLAKLIDKAGDESDLVGPNGKRWGWWRGKEAEYRAMSLGIWREIDAKNKPNGTWPWWAMGPPPGHYECIMPEQLVAERGYLETYRGQTNG